MWQLSKAGTKPVGILTSGELQDETTALGAAEPGFLRTEYKVMAALSHSEPKTMAIHMEEVRLAHLADAAIKRIHHVENVPSVPPIEKRGATIVKQIDKTSAFGKPMAVPRGIEPLFPG